MDLRKRKGRSAKAPVASSLVTPSTSTLALSEIDECEDKGKQTPTPTAPTSHSSLQGICRHRASRPSKAEPLSVATLQNLVPVATRKRPTPYSSPEKKKNRTLFYGSEEDTDTHEDSDEDTVPAVISRVERVYILDELNEEGPLSINLQWPLVRPALPTLSSADPVPAPDEIEIGPIDKYAFAWKAFPDAQLSPELRREPFPNINCGPTNAYDTPYDAFIAIWDINIMQHIVAETNKYAQQLTTKMMKNGELAPTSRITKWHNITVDELYVYFAIILATGIVIKSCLEEYWNGSKDIFGTPHFAKAMTYNRFHLINKCLHFTDNDKCDPNAMTKTEAKLIKILPIVQHLNDKFCSLYVLERNIALNVSLTQWKDCLNLKQYIRNKAGIKTYEVCEAQSGYLWRFEVHAGHDSSDPQEPSPISGPIPDFVLRLLRGLEYTGRTVWMDYKYNSPALARELKSLGFDCVGTLRTNRQFVPIELTNLTDSDLAVGEVCGCTSGDVDLILWRGKKLIGLISTYHGLSTVETKGVCKPALVQDYNLCMGGVDKKDQILAMYPIERKQTKIWYKKIFKRLLNASVLNAHILYKTSHQISHRKFRKSLVLNLLSLHKTNTQEEALPYASPQSRHFPDFHKRTSDGHRHLRRMCVVCTKQIHTYCMGCNKTLCLPTCFAQYHT